MFDNVRSSGLDFQAQQGRSQKQVGEGNLREGIKLPFGYDPRSGVISLVAGVSLDTAYVEVSGTATANGVCAFGTVVKDALGLVTIGPPFVVTPKTAGRYLVIYSGDANAGAAHRGMLYKKGVKVRDLETIAAAAAWSSFALIELALTDYVQIYDTAVVTTATLFQLIKLDNI